MLPRSLAERHDPSALKGQFTLSKGAFATPHGWDRRAVGSWTLAHDAALPVWSITAAGESVGWLLGHPITDEGTLLVSDLEVPFQGQAGQLEKLLDEFAGRFVAILIAVDQPRIYLDGAGSMGLVYSASQQIAASSLFLIPYTDPEDDRLALVRGPGLFDYDPHLHYGLTVRSSVDWLPPNHFLDLVEWKAVRHWPRDDLSFTTDIESTVSFVVERLRRNVQAVAQTGPVQMSLTAGKDTRLLLACARDFVEDIEFITYAISDHQGRIDVSVARHLARTFKLHHRVLGARPPTGREVERLLFRTGCVAAADPRCQESVNTLSSMNPTMPYVDATAGEMDRMPLYVHIDDDAEPLTIERLLGLRGYPAWPETVERGERWLHELPVENPHTVFDFRALEMRFGGWAGFVPYGYADVAKFFFYPFADRRIMDALIKLPPAYRRSDGVTRDAVSSQWPELLVDPFNDATAGAYGWYRRARRAAGRLRRPSTNAPSSTR